jgi:hypothetical protein
MAWQDVSLVGEWPKFFADAGEQLFVISVRKIGPTDPAAKEHIAPDDHIPRRQVKTKTVGRMPRNVKQGKRQPAELQGVFPGEQVLNRVGSDRTGNSHHLLESLGKSQVFRRFGIGVERAIKSLRENARIEDVVMMLVSQDDGIGSHSDLFQPAGHSLGCIEEPVLTTAPQEKSIGLKNAAAIMIDTDVCHDTKVSLIIANSTLFNFSALIRCKGEV